MTRLSILICHLPSRKDSFKRLRDQLAPQIDRPDVEVLTDNNDGSVGRPAREAMTILSILWDSCFIRREG